MRRKDRAMDDDFAFSVIDEAPYGVLAVATDDLPLALPLSFARVGNILYAHGAKTGEKTAYLKDGAKVRISFVAHAAVPEVITPEYVKKRLDEGATVASLASRLFTTEYASAIVPGHVHILTDDLEKRKGLRALSERYCANLMPWFDEACTHSLAVTEVYRIQIEALSAKRKRYDKDGNELKWGAELK